MRNATFACPDLTRFRRVDELGLEVIGQRLEARRAVLACWVVDRDQWCRGCDCEGAVRDSVTPDYEEPETRTGLYRSALPQDVQVRIRDLWIT